jgi:Holliday junction resolvase RusA-like endonuclease
MRSDNERLMPAWVLPFPPINGNVNHQWVYFGRGVYLRPEVRAWRDEVIILLRQAGQPLPSGPLAFELRYYPPDNRRRDGDGILKGVCDTVFAAFFDDDWRVYDHRVIREAKEKPGRLVVTIVPYDQINGKE